jgi:hypothetical protein
MYDPTWGQAYYEHFTTHGTLDTCPCGCTVFAGPVCVNCGLTERAGYCARFAMAQYMRHAGATRLEAKG